MNEMKQKETSGGLGFGTAPVFLAGVSTILGAILFLRFGYAVGNVGIGGAILLVLIGHAITIPTGLAVAEIATNLRVRGGGEYFMISRSFGSTMGGTIGISLYFSQAVSVAFYLIAFAESFRPLFPIIETHFGFTPDPRMISLPIGAILAVLIATRGANIGVNALWVVAGVLALSIGMFFLGSPTQIAPNDLNLLARVHNPDDFFKVFAIVFPAFTGMTAGVGLSGDLKNPRRSIPLGTLAATLTGLVVYILIVIKLGMSASPEELADDQFVMSKIAIWGPIIPIGLGAATISSALGSILVAPRTMQALAIDRIFPFPVWNRFIGRGRGASNEPVAATWVTSIVMIVFIAMGNVDFVAQIISMFFMITYGALCSISFLEHFAGNPSYRPTFRTKWYLSLIGAVASFIMMFQMQPIYAILSLIAMSLIYIGLRETRKGERSLSTILKGVLFQATRRLQIAIQKREASTDVSNWRPSFIAISRFSHIRLAPFDMLRWISHYYGFGSYIHFIEGPLNPANETESREVLKRLINQIRYSEAGIYVDTIISPSFKTAIAQIVQIPGISGMDNNGILFEFNRDYKGDLDEIVDGVYFAAVVGFNICILRSGDRHFGYRRSIHIYLNPGDYRNANLMILLSYIMLGHPDWKNCEISVFDTYIEDEGAMANDRLSTLISEGRLPIAEANVQRIKMKPEQRLQDVVRETSSQADLVVMGLSLKKMRQDHGKHLKDFPGTMDILFIHAREHILITEVEEEPDAWLKGDDNGNKEAKNPVVKEETSNQPDTGSETAEK